jgi:proline iminopeptidase
MDKIIQIPERKNAPKTRLHINIACKNKTQLGIRPIIFILPGGPGADGAAYKSYSCLLDVTDIVYYDPRGCGLKFVKNFGMETLLMPKK